MPTPPPLLVFTTVASGSTAFPIAEDKGRYLFQVRKAPGLSEAARSGPASYEHYPPDQDYSPEFSDFSNGAGLWEVTDPMLLLRYAWSKGIDSRRPRELRVAPAMNITQVLPDTSGVDGLNGPYVSEVVWRGGHYLFAGRAVYHWELVGSTYGWVLWDDHTSAAPLNIRAGLVHANNMIVQWETAGGFRVFTDPTDNTVFTDNVALGEFERAVSLGKTFYFIPTSGTVYANEDPTDAVLANWLGMTVGDTSFDVNEAWSQWDVVIVTKDDGLYAIDRDVIEGGEAQMIVSLRDRPSNDNLRKHATLGEEIWVCVGQQRASVLRINRQTGLLSENGHPRFWCQDVPQLAGSIEAMCSNEDASILYMVVKNKGTAGYLYNLVEVTLRDGRPIYHMFAGSALAPNAIHIDSYSGLTDPILWWYCVDTPYKPQYCYLDPDGSTYPYDTTSDNYLVTPWVTGYFPDLVKAFYNTMTQLKAFTLADHVANIMYQFDDASDYYSWAQVASLGTGGWTGPSQFPAGTTAKRFRLRIGLRTDVNTSTPIFEKAIIHGRLMGSHQALIQATIRLDQNNIEAAEAQRVSWRVLLTINAAMTLSETLTDQSWVGNIMRDTVVETIRRDDQGRLGFDISFAFLEADAASA